MKINNTMDPEERKKLINQMNIYTQEINKKQIWLSRLLAAKNETEIELKQLDNDTMKINLNDITTDKDSKF
jgi:hypothetical protein